MRKIISLINQLQITMANNNQLIYSKITERQELFCKETSEKSGQPLSTSTYQVRERKTTLITSHSFNDSPSNKRKTKAHSKKKR